MSVVDTRSTDIYEHMTETIQTLPLGHHALVSIVHDHYLDTDVRLRSGSEFHGCHAERSITVNVDHSLVRCRSFCTKCGWQAESHRLTDKLAPIQVG